MTKHEARQKFVLLIQQPCLACPWSLIIYLPHRSAPNLLARPVPIPVSVADCFDILADDDVFAVYYPKVGLCVVWKFPSSNFVSKCMC